MSLNPSQICFLQPDTEPRDAAGGPIDPMRARLLVLGRGLCRFTPFRPPPGLSGAKAAQAARLHAETQQPFANAACLILRRGDAFEIWHWDQDLLRARHGEALAARAEAIVPETCLQRPGEGWRHIANADGFEAQYWRDGALAASTWRRKPFTDQAWSAFTLAVESGEPAPPTPTPERTQLDFNTDWRARRVRPPLGWSAVEQSAATIAVCAAALCVFFAGQALRGAQFLAEEQAALASAPETPDAELARLRTLSAHAAAPNAMATLAEGMSIAARYPLEPLTWRADEDGFRISFAAPAGAVSIEEIVYAYERSALFADVTPQIEADDTLNLEARLERAP